MEVFGAILDDGTIDSLLSLDIRCQQGMITDDIDKARVAIRKRNYLANGTGGKYFFLGTKV